MVINLSKWGLLTGLSLGSKKDQLGPVNNYSNLHAQFFVYKNVLKPIFYCVVDKQCFEKKLGPITNYQKPPNLDI